MTYLFELFKTIYEAGEQGKEFLGFVQYQLAEEAQTSAMYWINSTFDDNKGDISALKSGQTRVLAFEVVGLSRSVPGSENVSFHRYVGRGENLQEAYRIRASEDPKFLEDEQIIAEARKLYGSDESVAYGVVFRFALVVRRSLGTDGFSIKRIDSVTDEIGEAKLYAKILKGGLPSEVLDVNELGKLTEMQASYEQSVADTISLDDKVEILAITKERDEVLANLQSAIMAHAAAAKEANAQQGLMIAGALLSLGGQISDYIDSVAAAENMHAVEASLSEVNSELAKLQQTQTKMAEALKKLGHSAPKSYYQFNYVLKVTAGSYPIGLK